MNVVNAASIREKALAIQRARADVLNAMPQDGGAPHSFSEKQARFDACAKLFQAENAVLMWHGNPTTGNYDGFTVWAWEEQP